MQNFFHRFGCRAAALGLLVSVLPAVANAQEEDAAALQVKVERLERELRLAKSRNQALTKSLAAANRSDQESAKALSLIKSRLAALDRSVFGDRDERLIEAVTSVDVLSKQVAELESAGLGLVATIQDYLATAVASNPESRVAVEESIRVLDSALGLRNKPRPNVATGTLSEASVVSIDKESGMLVLNVGSDVGANIGMTFSIRRGDQTLGEVTVVDFRSAVSGAFVDSLNDPNLPVRVGDTASLVTESL